MNSIGWGPDLNNNLTQNNSKESNTFTSTIMFIKFKSKQLKTYSDNSVKTLKSFHLTNLTLKLIYKTMKGHQTQSC